MPEVEFARETLAFVQFFLRMGVTNVWIYRMLIGRLYYAGHHLGRRLLMEAGMSPDQWRANVHRQVLQELQRHFVLTGRMSQEALDALSELRQLRRTADYDLVRLIRLRNVRHALALFVRFSDEAFQILGVS